MIRSSIFSALLLALVVQACSSGEERTTPTGPEEGFEYSLIEDSIDLTWTVYWKGDRSGYSGSFSNIPVSAPQEKRTPATIMEDAAVEIGIADIEAGGGPENSAVVEYFFGLRPDNEQIQAQVRGLKGGDVEGQVEIGIQMIHVDHTVVWDYAVYDHELVITGRLDLAEMGLASRLSKLNELFGEGKEMEEFVDIELVVKFNKVPVAGA